MKEDNMKHNWRDIVRKKQEHKPFTRVEDFGCDLKGLGGLQTSHIRALKGSTFGPASAGRKLSRDEVKAIEEQLRREGKLI